MMRIRLALWSGGGFIAAACVEVHQLMPPEHPLLGAAAAPAERRIDAPFLGLRLEEEIQGSLEDLQFQSGLAVVSVDKGSPAERAGLRAQDRVLCADAAPVSRMDEWSALLKTWKSGDRITLEVERDGAVSTVELIAAAAAEGELPPPTRWVEGWKLRATFETFAERGGTFVRVIDVEENSPLARAGLRGGAMLRAIDGEELRGAEHLLSTVDALPFGGRVIFDVEDGPAVERVRVRLWSPSREVTDINFPILFNYSRDLVSDKTSFAVLDFFVIALFDYRREGMTRRYRVLRFLRFESGVGVLEEVTPPTESRTTE